MLELVRCRAEPTGLVVRFETQGWISRDEDGYGELLSYIVHLYLRAQQVVRTGKYRYRKNTGLGVQGKQLRNILANKVTNMVQGEQDSCWGTPL